MQADEGPYWTDYRTYLTDAFTQRRSRNHRYSLRAFARDLGTNSSRLSEILSHKVGVSVVKARGIGLKLGLQDRQLIHFMDLVESQHARSETDKKLAMERVQLRVDKLKEMNADVFRLISDWKYFAILEYVKLPGKVCEPSEIANFFAIEEIFVIDAIQRLLRLGFLEMKDGVLVCSVNTRTTYDIPSAAIREAAKGVLRKAIDVVDQKPVEKRDISSTIFKFSKNDIPTIKQRIHKFRCDLMNEFEIHPKSDSVACLGISFFPLDGEDICGEDVCEN